MSEKGLTFEQAKRLADALENMFDAIEGWTFTTGGTGNGICCTTGAPPIEVETAPIETSGDVQVPALSTEQRNEVLDPR